MLEDLDAVSSIFWKIFINLKVKLVAVPLLHACLAEIPLLCKLQNSAHPVREERQVATFDIKFIIYLYLVISDCGANRSQLFVCAEVWSVLPGQSIGLLRYEKYYLTDVIC